MWLTSVNEKSRFMSDCATAPSTPTTMVSPATTMSRPETCPPGKSSVSVRMIA